MIESVRLALQGILSNRLRSALTMLGIMIGVAAVIILIAVGAGSSAAVQNQLAGLGTNTLTIFPTGGFGPPGGANRTGTSSRAARLTAKDVTALEDKTNAPNIVEVAPVVTAERDRDLPGRHARHRSKASARRRTTSRSATSRSRADPRSRQRRRGASQGRRARPDRRHGPVRRGRGSARRKGEDRWFDLDGHRRAEVEGNERLRRSGRHRDRTGHVGAGLVRVRDPAGTATSPCRRSHAARPMRRRPRSPRLCSRRTR